MADIKQAAKWMQEGLVVTRPSKWDSMRAGEEPRRTVEFVRQKALAYFTVSDLLADDWEIAG